jgi:hypothetical protein
VIGRPLRVGAAEALAELFGCDRITEGGAEDVAAAEIIHEVGDALPLVRAQVTVAQAAAISDAAISFFSASVTIAILPG